VASLKQSQPTLTTGMMDAGFRDTDSQIAVPNRVECGGEDGAQGSAIYFRGNGMVATLYCLNDRITEDWRQIPPLLVIGVRRNYGLGRYDRIPNKPNFTTRRAYKGKL